MDIDDVLALVRPDIRALKAYSSARSLASDGASDGASGGAGQSGVETLYLDANESSVEPFQGSVHLNRYDSQQPPVVLERLAQQKQR